MFPAYRRVDVMGFRGFAVVELVFIGLYCLINAAVIVALCAEMGVDGSGNVNGLESAANSMGIIGTLNVLVLLFPITRNSVWQYIMGISFDRAVWYHKWIARVAIIELGIHGAGIYAASWYGYNQSTLRYDAYDGGVTGTWASGSISFFIGVAIVLFSLNPFRRWIHEWFLRVHVLLFLGFIVFGFIHEGTVVLVVVALVLYAFDWILRFTMWRRPVQVLDISVLPGGVTRITFQMKGLTYQAGQWAMICIPAVTPWEFHPMSFSSSPHHSTMTFHIKTVGRWTRRLEELARSGRDMKQVKMHLEGPYGSISLPLDRYRHVMLCAGGIGVTPLGSVYNSLVHEHYEGTRVLHHLAMVWAVRDPLLISSLYDDPMKADMEEAEASQPQPTFFFNPKTLAHHDALVDTATFTPRRTTRLQESTIQPLAGRVKNAFHVTKVEGSAEVGKKSTEAVEWGEWMKEGRPELMATFAEMNAAMHAEMKERGGAENGVVRCAVLACGPHSMIREVRKATLRQSSANVKFDLHEEEFSW